MKAVSNIATHEENSEINLYCQWDSAMKSSKNPLKTTE